MNRARLREEARALCATVRATELPGAGSASIKSCLERLADAVEALANVSEDQDAMLEDLERSVDRA